MINSSELYHEIGVLTVLLHDQAITPSQLERFNALLADNPAAQKYYLECISVQEGLGTLVSSHYKASQVSEEKAVFEEVVKLDMQDSAIREMIIEKEAMQRALEEELLRQHRETQAKIASALRPPLWVRVAKIAAMVIAAVGIILLDRQLYRQESPEVLARLTAAENSQWAGFTPLMVGGDLTAGPLELQKGLAEITFANGAKVIMEAPARVHLRRDDELYLELGKVTIVASGSAIGFIVNTDNARVVDLGTEFGVAADAGGTMEVQVYQGEVALIPDWKQNRFQANAAYRMNLTKGQARRVNANHSVVVIPHSDVAFVRPEEFAVRQQAGRGDAYARWRAWSYQVRRDRDLVAYYTFEKDDSRPLALINYASKTQGKLNGVLKNIDGTENVPIWVEGRWPTKTALKLERNNHHQVTIPADPLFCLTDDISIAVWIRCPDEFKGGYMICNRQLYDVNFVFGYKYEKYPQGVLEFIRYEQSDSYLGGILTNENVYLSDGWMLLVVTYDNHRVRFYTDGKLLESQPYENTKTPVVADLIIGAMSEETVFWNRNRFNGIIDEVAIFQRVLREDEIRSMYEVGKPL